MTIFFLLSSSDKRSAFRGSLDFPVKPGNDREKKEHGNDEKKNKSKYGGKRNVILGRHIVPDPGISGYSGVNSQLRWAPFVP